MLKIIRRMSEINFSELMRVYAEGNAENGKELYRDDPETVQIRKAEDDFFHYLNSVFFRQQDSSYLIWAPDGHYQAALRIEPYLDGLLLCGLETAPDARRKGYATMLIVSAVRHLSESGSGILYSHVSKKNAASLSVHRKCGFQILKDYAVYADGSVLQSSYTLSLKYEKSEI